MWGRGGSIAHITLTNDSTILSSSQPVYIGPHNGATSSYANISLSTDSQINIGGPLRLAGRDTAFAGDAFTPAGFAVYNIPITDTATDGKVYVGGGISVGSAWFDASAGNNKVELRLTASDLSPYAENGGAGYHFTSTGTGASTSSVTTFNNNSRGLRIAERAEYAGRLVIDGVNITNVDTLQFAPATNSDAYMLLKGATITKNGTFDWIRFSGGTNSKTQIVLDAGHLNFETTGNTSATVDIRHGSSGSAEVRGKGSITFGQSNFRNDGRVVADGGDLSIIKGTGSGEITRQGHAINQTYFGQSGWYAENQGRLTLPDIAFASVDRMWGSTVTETSPVLVNSVFFDVTNTVTGTLAGSLYAPDHGSVPAGLVNPIGIWDFSGLNLTSGTVAMTVRYDDLHVDLTDETQLKFLHYTGGVWANITGSLNVGGNLITSNSISSMSFFAIAENFENASAVPEPSTYALGLLGLSGLALVAWRKRRDCD
jgi:hypothetical protein